MTLAPEDPPGRSAVLQVDSLGLLGLNGGHPTALMSLAVNGQIAQSVEQGTENPRVGGSIPPLATMLQGLTAKCNLGLKVTVWLSYDCCVNRPNEESRLPTSVNGSFYVELSLRRQ